MRTTITIPTLLLKHAKMRATAIAKENGRNRPNLSQWVQTLIADDWRKTRQQQTEKV